MQDVDNDIYSTNKTNRIGVTDYFVHKGELLIDLPPIYAFCYHERVQILQPSTMILPDGLAVNLGTIDDLGLRGIYIEQANMTSTLRVDSDDETLYDHQFEIQVKSSLSEELTWFNTTFVKINFLKPPCEVTQEEINSVGKG